MPFRPPNFSKGGGNDPLQAIGLLLRLREDQRAEQRFQQSVSMAEEEARRNADDQLMTLGMNNTDVNLDKIAGALPAASAAGLQAAKEIQKGARKKAEAAAILAGQVRANQLNAAEVQSSGLRVANPDPIQRLRALEQVSQGFPGGVESPEATRILRSAENRPADLSEESRLMALDTRQAARKAAAVAAVSATFDRHVNLDASLARASKSVSLGEPQAASVQEKIEEEIRNRDPANAPKRIAEARFRGQTQAFEQETQRVGLSEADKKLRVAAFAAQQKGTSLDEELAIMDGRGFTTQSGKFVLTDNSDQTKDRMNLDQQVGFASDFTGRMMNSADRLVASSFDGRGLAGTDFGTTWRRFIGKQSAPEREFLLWQNRATIIVARMWQDARLSDFDLAFVMRAMPGLQDVFPGSQQLQGSAKSLGEFYRIMEDVVGGNSAARKRLQQEGIMLISIDPSLAASVEAFKGVASRIPKEGAVPASLERELMGLMNGERRNMPAEQFKSLSPAVGTVFDRFNLDLPGGGP